MTSKYPSFWPKRWEGRKWKIYCWDGERPARMIFDQDYIWRAYEAIPDGPAAVERAVVPGKIFAMGSPLICSILQKLLRAKLIEKDSNGYYKQFVIPADK